MFRDYINAGGNAPEHALSAAEHIDILTGFKIVDFASLTAFQQSVIRRVHNKLEQFERENEDILDSPLSSYSVNGVSMAFGEKIKAVSGVILPAELYALLCSTGLCCPAI